MKKILFCFTPLFLCLALVVSTCQADIRTSESIAEKVFRLHIIANSDTEEDQEIKLMVRDAILQASKRWYCHCHSADEAAAVSRQHLQEAEQLAGRVLAAHHFHYTVTAVVDQSFFDTRKYNGFTLPSGTYQCLRIILGKGEGHNWWCVLFPSVCLSACSDGFDGVLSDEEQDFIGDSYTIKFKVVELYEAYLKPQYDTTGQ